MPESAPRNDSLVTTVLVSALVATLVGGCIGGVAGAFGYFLARADQPKIYTFDDEEPADDDAAFAPESVDWDAIIESAIGADDEHRHLYSVDLPSDAVFVEVKLEGDGVDLDLQATFGRDEAIRGDWGVVADSSSASEVAGFARLDSPEFGAGPLYVEVTRYGHGGDDDEPEPYTLTFRVVRPHALGTLHVGESADGMVSPETGHRADFDVVVPADTDTVRIDLVGVRQNLELAADAARVMDTADAAVVTDAPIGREYVIVNRRDMHLPDGDVTVSLAVVDPAFLDREIPFRVIVTAGTDAPDEVKRLPAPFEGETPQERVTGAIVGVLALDDEGSGVVVRKDGMILTAAHVVESIEDDTDDVVIMICDDPRREPLEALRGRVVRRDADLDIAIIQVTQTLHGDPLPESFALPTVPVRWAERSRIAEPTSAVGYPALHEAAERSEITWTRGVIAGFETTHGFELVRFDAEIRGGSSGGALLDDENRLLGITIATHEDSGEFSATGLALPVTEIPAEWLDLLR